MAEKLDIEFNLRTFARVFHVAVIISKISLIIYVLLHWDTVKQVFDSFTKPYVNRTTAVDDMKKKINTFHRSSYNVTQQFLSCGKYNLGIHGIALDKSKVCGTG